MTTTPEHTFPITESLSLRLQDALDEDLFPSGDITTDAVFSETARGTATVVAKENGVICGTEIFAEVFNLLGKVKVSILVNDGSHVKKGDIVITLSGTIRSLLAGERTALNLLQRMSGIASMTALYVEAAAGKTLVCDTRKTTPLWRDLEKYAVTCGGGTNHRMGLYDMVMLKDTHADGAGGIAHALAKVKSLREDFKIAAEARTLDEVREILDGGADLIMLDNMNDETLQQAVALIARRIPTEVTGGVTLDRIPKLAALGIDRVSAGALTHSARALDFSMKLSIDGRK